MPILYYFAIGAAGAAAYELIHLYRLMGVLPEKKFKKMLVSGLYASVTLGLVVASGFIAWAINANTDATPWQLVISGIGARSLLAKPIELKFAHEGPTLGASSNDENKITLRDLFR